MRILSILSGLTFAVMAGYLLACAFLAPAGASLMGPVDMLSWAVAALALATGIMAWLSRCEGWVTLVGGCATFLSCHVVLLAGLGAVAVPALLCLVAAGFALSPLAHMPNSYWRVAG